MGVIPVRMMVGLCFGVALLTHTAQAEAPEIVASIKPVHSLVAALMEGVAEPTLLIKGGGSPHVYALRPSEARALVRADIVVWVGDDLETFLVRPLGTLAADARIVALIEADGLSLLQPREGGAWETHDLGHEKHGDKGHSDEDHERHIEAGEHDHGAGEVDMHLWLDPRNGAAMARSITTVLIEADPDNAPVYRSNLARLNAGLSDLERSIGESLEAVRETPFVVFHDAYQYFERRFDVNAVGSITVSPENQPGAARLRELQGTIAATDARCVFSEPQFEPRLLNTIVEGTEARAGVLDPLGSAIPAGPGQYFALLRGMADSLVDCLVEPGAG